MAEPATRVVLASASPRRVELLATLGIRAEVRPARIDETLLQGESPHDAAERLAVAKARAVHRPDAITIGGDTLVTIDGVALGQPTDAAHAEAMLTMLSGRTHEVVSGVAVLADGFDQVATVVTEVRFASLDADTIRRYVAFGEGADKAGGYALQGRAAVFVEAVHGDHTNVIGLPLRRLSLMLAPLGLGPLAPGR